jgi:hypothetical protein
MVTQQLPLWPTAPAAPRLAWSFSRAARLQACRRQYYLYHMASAGGRRPNALPVVRELYILKHLRNRFMWVGEIVHSLIEEALTTQLPHTQGSCAQLQARGVRRMRQDFAQSSRGAYRERPGESVGLSEHAYGDALTPQAWQQLRQRLERCLDHYFSLPWIARLAAVPAHGRLAQESLGTFEVEGVRVVVKPDFAWREPSGQIHIADWKTGLPSAAGAQQMHVYGLYAEHAWGSAGSLCQAHLVYLEPGSIDSLVLQPAGLATAAAAIVRSAAQMRQLAAAPALPLGAGPAQAAFDAAFDGQNDRDFLPTEDLSTCRRCSFRQLCRRG